jgi:hypothetical protein
LAFKKLVKIVEVGAFDVPVVFAGLRIEDKFVRQGLAQQACYTCALFFAQADVDSALLRILPLGRV